MDNDKLKKALQLYLEGKNNIYKNDILAKDNFKKSLEVLTEIKKLDNSAKYIQIIQTTEADCIKHLQSDNIFELITTNNLNKIKQLDNLNFREINSVGNTILHHAIEVGDTSILKEMLKKGGMIDTVNGNGFTLLEYACLRNDPNMISFILSHGANMKKHIFFRKGENKHYLHKSDIDMAILLKLVIVNSIKPTKSYKLFASIEKYFHMNELVGLDKYTIKDILIGLHNMFINKESYKSYITIITEDLNEYELNKTVNKCIHNKIDILLSNLVPFINYPFNMASIFLLKNEIKYLIKNIIKHNKNFKDELMEKLFDVYIQPGLFQEDYIGIIVYNILSKIKI